MMQPIGYLVVCIIPLRGSGVKRLFIKRSEHPPASWTAVHFGILAVWPHEVSEPWPRPLVTAIIEWTADLLLYSLDSHLLDQPFSQRHRHSLAFRRRSEPSPNRGLVVSDSLPGNTQPLADLLVCETVRS